jgi:hypothetical protein
MTANDQEREGQLNRVATLVFCRATATGNPSAANGAMAHANLF